MCETLVVLWNVDWSAIASWLTAISTAVLSGVAVAGLSTWRKEHEGKSRYDAAYNILKIVYQIQGLLWLEPIVYHKDKRVPSETVIREMPDVFVDTVHKQAQRNWSKTEALVSELHVEGMGSKSVLGKVASEKVRLLVSSLRAVRPGYQAHYTPSSEEMDGKKLTAEQFTQQVVRNAILNLPERIADLEEELVQYVGGQRSQY